MEPLVLQYQDIILRDRIPADIPDHRRWLSTETAWLEWDAPWESNNPNFISRYLEHMERQLQEPLPAIRRTLEICHRDGTHIGLVNAYYIDGDRERLAVGIGLRESSYWGKGLGTMAFRLWLAYLFAATGNKGIYCQTWSGNIRMMKLAGKCCFSLWERKKDFRQVKGQPFDALTYVLRREVFWAMHPDLAQTFQQRRA
ncbi:MAG: GNAT family N-acetyltransferase [Bacillota bacterium]|jgi:RimJ/RimL family protein N-acetyltransferase|nr:GNAT family N-acetyltransferase [Bacillota bacterium]HPZ23005.1 GNAT family N-acetyltransferase [Bacillota bacterium]HQD19909.1 GNAT family N-acetyltransferase [Bacillota bacterium]